MHLESQPKILLVDDEPSLLEAHRRILGRHFKVEIACDADVALSHLLAQGPFAAVVCDVTMPGMDGFSFVRRLRELEPTTVRILSTGYHDPQAALDLINDGTVFRFLHKPCDPKTMKSTLEAAIAYHRAQVAEKSLVHTLTEITRVLVTLLGIARPTAFRRASLVAEVVLDVANDLKLPDPWEFELAATLWPLGSIAVPSGCLEQIAVDELCTSTQEYLRTVPHLEGVLQMLNQPPALPGGANPLNQPRAHLGHYVVRLGQAYDSALAKGLTPQEALSELHAQPAVFSAVFLASLSRVVERRSWANLSVPLESLEVGMQLRQDVTDSAGHLLVGKEQRLTGPLLEFLRRRRQWTDDPRGLFEVAQSST